MDCTTRIFLDRVERKLQSWRLLSQEECEWVYRHPPGDFRKIPHVLASNEYGKYSNWTEAFSCAVHNLHKSFSLLDGILSKHRGELVLAGGAVARSLCPTSSLMYCDCDLFFVGANPDSTLISAIHYICEHVDPFASLTIERGQHVVNVIAGSAKYSFILRKYPSPAHVVGGFDISASAVLYDGNVITGTELGFWSAVNHIIPVDTTRRSTSYEYRLLKYNVFCTILLPGLDLDRYYEDLRSIAIIRSARAQSALARDGLTFSIKWRDQEYCQSKGLRYEDRALIAIDYTNVIKEEMRAAVEKALPQYHEQAPTVKISPSYQLQDKALRIVLAEMNGLPAHANGMRSTTKGSRSGNIIHDKLRLRCPNDIGCAFRDGDRYSISPSLAYRLETTSPERYGRINQQDIHLYDYDFTGQAREVVPELLICQNLARYVSITHYAGGPLLLPPIDPTSITPSNHTKNPRELNPDRILQILTTPNFTPDSAVACADQMWNNLEMYGRVLKKYIRTFRGHDPKTAYCNGKVMIREELRAQIRDEASEIHGAFSRLDWIIQDPGRQWTSSINPIVENPADWYGYYHRKVAIGNVELETTMRLLRLRPPFNALPRDIFKMLLLQILITDARALLEPRATEPAAAKPRARK